jgi:hypothetical protein
MAYARVLLSDISDEPKPITIGHELVSGARSGGVAGLVMAVAMMAMSTVFLGKSPFYPIQVIGTSILGEDAVAQLDARALLLGIAVHELGPSLAWGVAFGIMVWTLKPRRSLALMMCGLLVGVLSQIVDVYVLIPLLSGTWGTGFELLKQGNLWALHIPSAASWLGHLVFGFALSLYPWKYDPVLRAFD